jgi:hypothetical protein
MGNTIQDLSAEAKLLNVANNPFTLNVIMLAVVMLKVTVPYHKEEQDLLCLLTVDKAPIRQRKILILS